MSMRRRGSRGIALIIVVGVLSVLAVVATAFVMMAELERKASRQRFLSAKAYLLARSGIEDALARFAMGQDHQTVASNSYRGEDWNNDTVVNAGAEFDGQVFRPSAVGTPADLDTCPVRQAMRPTWWRNAGGNPRLVPVDGRSRGYSGLLGGDYRDEGNHYALKVTSPDGFFVNGGDPAVPTVAGPPPVPPGSYNDILKRILGTLAKAIDEEQGGIDGSPLTEADGWNLIDARPLSGWASLSQIQSLALGGSQAKLDAIRPYLKLKAWVDKRVVMPNVTDTMIDKDYFSWGGIKLDHRANPQGATRAPDFERIPRAAGGAIVGRTPVSLGWAKTRKPALIALLSGLKGLWLDESTSGNMDAGILGVGGDAGGDRVGTLRSAEIACTWVPGDNTHVAANAIFAYAGPLDTWQQWNSFCGTIGGLTTAQRDILKANFNPNTALNKFNPNPTFWKTVDKSDLLAYSTEFSLFPLQGLEVSSAGRVLGSDGRLLAVRILRASLSGPNVVRLSTQREFVCENLGNLDAPGDETSPRLPGFAIAGTQAFLSQSQGNVKTWGHRLDTTVLAPAANYAAKNGNWMNGASLGAGLQSYPEPCYDTTPNLAETFPDPTATTLMIQPADYDGNLQLATVEALKDDTYAGPNNMMMLARFDDGLDLDVADGYPGNLNAKDCQADSTLVTRALLGNSAWVSDIRINTLYPDGCYTEAGRAPSYFDANSANGFNGLMSFWLKSNSTQISKNRGSRYVYWTHNLVADKKTDPTAVFWVGYSHHEGNGPAHEFALFFGIAHDSKDDNKEHRYSAETIILSHTWKLMTVGWDEKAADADAAGEVVMDFNKQYSLNTYPSAGNAGASAEDRTLPDRGGAHRICLGVHQNSWEPWYQVGPGTMGAVTGSGADTTLDDFALYDFGGGEGLTGGPVLTYAQGRYVDGRYYKEAAYRAPGAPPLAAPPGEAGSWISAPIILPAGCTLQKVAWTWHRPTALPTDYPNVELLNTACTGTLWPTGSSSGRKDSQSWNLNRIVTGDFRVRVVFQRDVAVPAGTAILDSPVFDDLSLVYQTGSGGFLTWEEGGE